ncbi:MAG: hypothetical protein LBT97_10320 [Planctomycetota bacterium]|nr:hypothetical protein [Planctomycetota bacterium]
MARDKWTWKAKDGTPGGLLYAPGNWGDLLKALWLTTFITWSREGLPDGIRHYVDPFAGAPDYPLGAGTKCGFLRGGLESFSYIDREYLRKGLWPSSAALFRSLSTAPMTVFDVDAERRERWRNFPGATVADAGDGWDVLQSGSPAGNDLYLVDPYDFLAQWRGKTEALLAKTAPCTLLLYVYNRSAKKAEHFREYRAFRGFLDGRTGGEYIFGRVGSDPFLPSSHHEMYLFPSPEARGSPVFALLAGSLERTTLQLDAVMRKLSVFGNQHRFF